MKAKTQPINYLGRSFNNILFFESLFDLSGILKYSFLKKLQRPSVKNRVFELWAIMGSNEQIEAISEV